MKAIVVKPCFAKAVSTKRSLKLFPKDRRVRPRKTLDTPDRAAIRLRESIIKFMMRNNQTTLMIVDDSIIKVGLPGSLSNVQQ